MSHLNNLFAKQILSINITHTLNNSMHYIMTQKGKSYYAYHNIPKNLSIINIQDTAKIVCEISDGC